MTESGVQSSASRELVLAGAVCAVEGTPVGLAAAEVTLVRDAAWFTSGVSALAASHRVGCRRGQAMLSTCARS